MHSDCHRHGPLGAINDPDTDQPTPDYKTLCLYMISPVNGQLDSLMRKANMSVDEEKVRPFISGIAGLRTESDAGSVIQRWPKPKTEARVDQPPTKRESLWARATLTFSQHSLEETEKAIRPLQHMMHEL